MAPALPVDPASYSRSAGTWMILSGVLMIILALAHLFYLLGGPRQPPVGPVIFTLAVTLAPALAYLVLSFPVKGGSRGAIIGALVFACLHLVVMIIWMSSAMSAVVEGVFLQGYNSSYRVDPPYASAAVSGIAVLALIMTVFKLLRAMSNPAPVATPVAAQ